MGSAPSQYFQGDGAKPRAQSHNLSYNSTGWVASAVLVNTLFHSVCLLITHPSIYDLSSFPHLYFVLTCLYSLFFYFILNIFFSSLFLLHLRASAPSNFKPSTNMHHLTFLPYSPTSPFHGGPLPVCISRTIINWCSLILCSICVWIWFIVCHCSDFIAIYCFLYN